MNRRLFPVLSLALFVPGTAPLTAQQTRVDYPDSALVSPPELFFPFYTLGGGGTVRYQTMCPATFAALPAQPMLVTGIGLQIAGQERYDRFEVRFGATAQGSIGNCWTANLPDQRLQHDLSGRVLPGGLQNGQPVNTWVELALDAPFLWTPGEGLVLDVTASASVPGLWCLTGTGSGDRVYAAPYTGQTCGAIVPGNGLKLRMVFEPPGLLLHGQGCPGAGGATPALSLSGSAAPGGMVLFHLTNALGGAPTSLLLGLSRTNSAAGPLPLPLGGGCSVQVSADAVTAALATGTGPGQGAATLPLFVPNDPSFAGFALFAQWAQIDGSSPAVVPITLSGAGTVIVL